MIVIQSLQVFTFIGFSTIGFSIADSILCSSTVKILVGISFGLISSKSLSLSKLSKSNL